MGGIVRRLTAAAGLTCALLFVLASSGLAQSEPSLPAAYYGTVYLNGSPAPIGTVIVAKIAGEIRGSITVQEAGKYGGAGALESKLVVQGASTDEGKSVVFEVGGVLASQTVAYKPGDVRQVDLTAVGIVTQVVGISATIGEAGQATLSQGESINVAVSATLVDGTTRDVTSDCAYATSNPQVATVSGQGVVTAVAPGQAAITARYQGFESSVAVTVVPALTGIEVSPAAVNLTPGQTAQLAVAAKYSDGSSVDVTARATYVTSNPQVATVSGQGVVTAVAPGQATITVSYQGKEATTRVTVSQAATPPVGGGGGTVPPPSPPSPPNKVEVTIEPGRVALAEIDEVAKVEVQPGAVTGTNARLLLTALQESEAAPILNLATGIEPASPVVDVSVKDGQVSGTVTVVLSYDPGKVPSGRMPAAYFYSDRKSCWVYLGGKVDPGSKTVSVAVSHLTKFAVFARDPVPAFTDMQGHWAEQVVARLAGMGVVSGYPGNVFKPGAEISRVECTAMLVRALGLQAAGEEGLTAFKDSANIPSWARGLVAAAVKASLVKGYPEEDGSFTFRAGNPVTRGELAVLVARIMAKEVGPVTGTVSQFADGSKIPDWAKESVGAAAAKGIIKGYEDGTFRAANNVTRSEA
ncbi:MAG: S-layer homology domain-containing protein, partial [Bacillota bacterium]